jgi:Rieske Fe-S protein
VDGLPYIGIGAGTKHVYVASGYAGTGMTYGTLAAHIISDQILERENPATDLYKPSRVKPLAAAAEFIRENINVGKRLVLDRLSTPDVQTFAEIPMGQGSIAEIEGEKIAVYRDEQGEIHLLSAECTHLGCIVSWNNAENTWDCPCHGGRYTPTGKVVEGPPPRNLEFKQLNPGPQS